MLSNKSIEEYKRIFKKKFGKEISDEEALEQVTRLVNFFEILHKINVKDKIRKKKSINVYDVSGRCRRNHH